MRQAVERSTCCGCRSCSCCGVDSSTVRQSWPRNNFARCFLHKLWIQAGGTDRLLYELRTACERDEQFFFNHFRTGNGCASDFNNRSHAEEDCTVSSTASCHGANHNYSSA